MNKFRYDVIIINGEEKTRIDWGNQPGWIEENADRLDNADSLWLVPKNENTNFRNVSVKLGDGKRWILFSRVFGRSNSGLNKQVRLYAIGWQKTIGGVNQKSLMWIYPSGEMELGENPTYVNVFLDML